MTPRALSALSVVSVMSVWLRAARLPAQVNIAVPLLCGQAFASFAGYPWRAIDALEVFAFGLFDQLAIVFANDAQDEQTDRENLTYTPFSGGSRVLVLGELQGVQLLRAAGLCAVLGLGIATRIANRVHSAVPVLLAVTAFGLLWAYSFPPLRLAYRGGGEVLQVLGTGVVLPTLGFVGQGAPLSAFHPAWLLMLVPLRLGCACATALPDEPSDRASNKRSLVVLTSSRTTSWLMFAAALVAWSLAASGQWSLPKLSLAALAPSILSGLSSLALLSAAPGTRAMLMRAGSAVLSTLAYEIALCVQLFGS